MNTLTKELFADGRFVSTRQNGFGDIAICQPDHGEDVCKSYAVLFAASPLMLKALEPFEYAANALTAYERDYGEPLPDNHEIGRIDESRETSSFRIRVGHIRALAAALRAARGEE